MFVDSIFGSKVSNLSNNYLQNPIISKNIFHKKSEYSILQKDFDKIPKQ